jgi:hypothetical protein
VSLVTQDGSYNGYGSASSSLPHDWTEGTGIIPVGGIVIPNPSLNGQARKWLFIQNQDAVTVTVALQTVTTQGQTTAIIVLSPNTLGVGTQGGALEFGGLSWKVNGAITVTPAGAQVACLEVLE